MWGAVPKPRPQPIDSNDVSQNEVSYVEVSHDDVSHDGKPPMKPFPMTKLPMTPFLVMKLPMTPMNPFPMPQQYLFLMTPTAIEVLLCI